MVIGMRSKELFKTIILTLLVLMSAVLTYMTWNFSPDLANVNSHDSKDKHTNTIGKPLKGGMPQVITPYQIIHSNGDKTEGMDATKSNVKALTKPLKDQFHYGFMLQGNGKVFGAIGIALAMYSTTPKENKKKVAALLIPATLTAVVVGITEPLEFTFLFIAPYLFVIHAILAATMDTIMYGFGLVGNFGGGLIDFFATNWIPLGQNHWMTYLIQIR